MRTPSQTVGPYFSFGLCTRPRHELPGGDVRLEGRVLDAEGAPVSDALLEVCAQGAWGRCGTDAGGRFAFLVPSREPRLELMVFARGLLKPCLTRVYLDGEPEDGTMLARREGDAYRYDVRLGGDGATAFFELD